MTAKEAAQKAAPWAAALGALGAVVTGALGYSRTAIVMAIVSAVGGVLLVAFPVATTVAVPQAAADARYPGAYGDGGPIADIEGYSTESTKTI